MTAEQADQIGRALLDSALKVSGEWAGAATYADRWIRDSKLNPRANAVAQHILRLCPPQVVEEVGDELIELWSRGWVDGSVWRVHHPELPEVDEDRTRVPVTLARLEARIADVEAKVAAWPPPSTSWPGSAPATPPARRCRVYAWSTTGPDDL